MTHVLDILGRPQVRWPLYIALLFALGWAWGWAAALGGPLPLVGVVLAVVAGLYAISRASFNVQMVAACVILLALFTWFFVSFNLRYDGIERRLPSLLGFELRNVRTRATDAWWEIPIPLMGAALTLFICLVAIAFSTMLALVIALMRLSSNGFFSGVAMFYISFFRGTPLLVQILLIYIGLPQLGIVLNNLPAAILALTLCYGAYMAEIFRAGILAVPAGQREAAYSVGLTRGQTMRLVVLPQAMRLIVPPTGNQFIAMLKDSALVSTLGAWELTKLSRMYGRTDGTMEMLISIAIIYWMLSIVFELIQARIERYYGKGFQPR